MTNKGAISGSDKFSLMDLNQQGANALLEVTFEFLRRSKLSNHAINEFLEGFKKRGRRKRSRHYDELLRAYEEMGVINATWFSDPRFLDRLGNPISISNGKGLHSIAGLIKVSRARISRKVALELMKQSPSIKFTPDDRILAVRRVFVLPDLEVLRAAFVVERFLDTLRGNAAARKRDATLLMERSCHVSAVNLTKIAPMIRDIERRGTAFMDSIDGEIESRRLRKSNGKSVGELGVSVFAWARPIKRMPAGKSIVISASGRPVPNRGPTNSVK